MSVTGNPPDSKKLVLGLMSGTSFDGADAALVCFGDGIPRLLHHHYTPWPARLRSRIKAATGSDALQIADLDYELGRQFSRAALLCLQAAGIAPEKVDAIASHGQTIAHIPTGSSRAGATMQIGSPAVMARETGIAVISDFRAADIAAGGQGAPLVPFADKVLFGHLAPVAIHNIGGISNVTVIDKEITAYDTGPGNSLMDEAARRLLNKPCDRAGAVARKGKPNMRLLKKLLSMAYFRKKPPKSTGREMFGAELYEQTFKGSRMSKEDILCTLTHFTAHTIAHAYDKFVLPVSEIEMILISGGGTMNKYLMELVSRELDGVAIKLTDEFGVPSAAREAMSFAILGHETLCGRPSNVPKATGAKSLAILGSASPKQ